MGKFFSYSYQKPFNCCFNKRVLLPLKIAASLLFLYDANIAAEEGAPTKDLAPIQLHTPKNSSLFKSSLPNNPINTTPHLDVTLYTPRPQTTSIAPTKELSFKQIDRTETLLYDPLQLSKHSKVYSFPFREHLLPLTTKSPSSPKGPLQWCKSTLTIPPSYLYLNHSESFTPLSPVALEEQLLPQSLQNSELPIRYHPATQPAKLPTFEWNPISLIPTTYHLASRHPKAIFTPLSSLIHLSQLKPLKSVFYLSKSPLAMSPSVEPEESNIEIVCNYPFPNMSYQSNTKLIRFSTNRTDSFPLENRKIFPAKTPYELHIEQREITGLYTSIQAKTYAEAHRPEENHILKEFSPVKEGLFTAPFLHSSSNKPYEPTCDSSTPPLLTINQASPSIKTKRLTQVKKQLHPNGLNQQDLLLPNLQNRAILSTQAMKDTSIPEVMKTFFSRSPKYPNTNRLITGRTCPSRIALHERYTPSTEKEGVTHPQTRNISSRAQEIIAHYSHESHESSNHLSLIHPNMETRPIALNSHEFNQTHRLTQAFLSEIPTPSHLETISFQNEFETEVYYIEKSDETGYDFVVKIKPNKRLYFEAPEQNVIFVLDGSSSIKKERFNVFKKGITNSLPYLKKGDSFNILIADAELHTLSQTSLPFDSKAKKEAQSFLNSRPYRGFFTKYTPFDLLSKTPSFFDPIKENIVILLTDGNTLNSIAYHKEELQKLKESTQNNVSIYTASASRHNNLPMLDLLTTFNNGESIYAPTHAAFPRKLAALVKHIGNTTAKHVHIQIASEKKTPHIEFYPNLKIHPPLYSDRPYTIFGTTSQLEDFDLILQAQTEEAWINIKQHISFKNAQKAPHSMQRSLALQKAYVCYDYFLEKHDHFFLSEANRILQPYSLPSITK